MPRVHLDFETRCELDLSTVGLARYVSHWSFEVLLTGVASGDSPAEVYPGFWSGLHDLKRSDLWEVHAFNAPFEIAVCQTQGLVLPLTRWHCTKVRAHQLGFSGSLANIGAQVGLPIEERKRKDGTRLVNKFCSPRRPSAKNPDRYWTKATAPEDWAKFVDYCRQDVVAERAIRKRLDGWAGEDETDEERALWCLDQKINARGLPVDVDFCERAIEADRRFAEEATSRMQALTGLNPGQTAALLAWCKEHGYPHDNLQAATIDAFLEEDLIPF
jgi:DNA polymerase bacteriophage-type